MQIKIRKDELGGSQRAFNALVKKIEKDWGAHSIEYPKAPKEAVVLTIRLWEAKKRMKVLQSIIENIIK